ncbi:hypothetical protein AM501_27850 [Aneurinibacillus migulanus]|uniref:LiaG family protein n=1 Tax=Aneurinibacillus migulanus TaxID=47500 RepID=UPI0005BBFBA2|nr:DUF4097 domain-containing protein [Aneurinibacillus migulanus]KIV53330.1 hypothetical protein TS64_20430 [Aneurinibacillus migulanus]KPD05161.1 hypothetical protein AM501_27850 [Aneurinibacillus migulanus]MCP1356333.1 DUF4097 domain-containing protein [Aneurinibacillus migulanus]
MKKLIGFLFIVFGTLLLLGILANSVLGGALSKEGRQVQTVSPDNIENMNINVSSADVRIIPEDRQDIEAVLQGRNVSKNQLSVKQSGNTLKVSLEQKEFKWVTFSNHLTLDLHIPQEYNRNMIIDAGSGDIEFKGVNENRTTLEKLELHMSSGTTILENLDVKLLKYKGSSGSTRVENVTAEATDIDISSGDVELSHYSGALRANLSSGDLRAEFEELTGPVKIGMTSGSVSLHMPENADFTLQGHTTSGSIHCDLPLQNRKENEDEHLSGSYGNGSHAVQITASSGDINIE